MADYIPYIRPDYSIVQIGLLCVGACGNQDLFVLQNMATTEPESGKPCSSRQKDKGTGEWEGLGSAIWHFH